VGHETFPGGRKYDPPPRRDVALAALAAGQHGIATLLQLREIGFADSAVSKRVRAGRLHRVHRGVYAVGHGALSQEGRWLAAVLASGDGAALSHLAAAACWQVWRARPPQRIDVVAPRRRHPGAGIRVHRCSHLDPRDTTLWRGIPVTTVARTLVDLTDELDEHQLANVIHEAAFRKRFDLATTRAAIRRANGRRRLGVLDAALDAHAAGSAGTRSRLEDRFLALVRAAGLPAPLVNVKVETATRDIEVDFHWPDKRLCVEIDGPGHARPRTKRQDDARDAELSEAGQEVLRFTEADLTGRPSSMIAVLAARA
jgi:very-short-patch-repair endonuclease/predicted transcriptional regulator of viral defense system